MGLQAWLSQAWGGCCDFVPLGKQLSAGEQLRLGLSWLHRGGGRPLGLGHWALW